MNAYTKLAFALSRIKTASKADKLLRAGKLLPSSVARLLGKVNLDAEWDDGSRFFAAKGLANMRSSAHMSLPALVSPKFDWRDALPIIRKGRATPNNPWASMTPNVKSPNPAVQSMVDFSRTRRPPKMNDRSTPNLTRDVNLDAQYDHNTHTVNLPPGYDTKMVSGHEIGHVIGFNTPTFQRANHMLDADRYLKKFAPATHDALRIAYPSTIPRFRGELEAQWLATRSKANSPARIRSGDVFYNTYPPAQEKIKDLGARALAAINEASTNDPSGRARSIAQQLIINHELPVN